MDWFIGVRAVVLFAVGGGLFYLASRKRRAKKTAGLAKKDFDFHPIIGFTRMDGGKSVALLLDNRSVEAIWAEEIEIALTDLIANQQTSEASGHTTLKIRQTIRRRDMLPISLVAAIYEAAGKPQRKYSCMMSSIVRYRIGEEWYEQPMRAYKLKMVGLTTAGIRREHGNLHQFQTKNKPEDFSA